MALVMLTCAWCGNQFTPLLLMYRDLGGYSEVTVDLFLGAYVLGLVPSLLVAGALSDRYGRKTLTWAGLGASLVASLVLAAGVSGPVPIYLGRFFSGLAVGAAMVVGTSWLKELSQPPFSTTADPGAPARRASLALTFGFGLGAAFAGVLAQWGPWPMVLPYAVHILISVPGMLLLTRVPETRTRREPTASLRSELRVPEVRHARFLRVVLPLAPWVFGASAVAYAVMPQLVSPNVGEWGLAYATLLTAITLGTGVLVQPLAKRLSARSLVRTILVGMGLLVAGLALSSVNGALRSPWIGLGCAVLLGGAYGIALVSGLLEVQRMGRPETLSGLTGVYYALSYAGFLLPALLAALAAVFSYTVMLAAVTLVAVACAVLVGVSARTTGLPAGAPSSVVRTGGGTAAEAEAGVPAPAAAATGAE